MRNKIFGTAGTIIGLLLLANVWINNRLFGTGFLEPSQKEILIAAGLFLVASIYIFFKKPNEPKS